MKPLWVPGRFFVPYKKRGGLIASLSGILSFPPGGLHFDSGFETLPGWVPFLSIPPFGLDRKGTHPSGCKFRTQVICNPLGGGPPLQAQLPAAPVIGLDGEVLSPHPPGGPDSPPTLLRRLGGSAGSG